ncbi:MAG: hypothetical protein E5V78_18115 [Mesorhizobium sp.]|nr:MAG: hypothetical protein E5V78_18115 [Mesorhizobium sp.]
MKTMLTTHTGFRFEVRRARPEVAICIREDRKHLGVSWEFLGYVARYADDHGIETIESIESRENRAAIELEREMGFIVTTDPDDPTLVLVQRKLGASLPG